MNKDPYGKPSATLVGTPALRRPAKPPRRLVVLWAGACRDACDVHAAPQVAAICDDYFKALAELAAAQREIERLRSESFDVPTKVRAPSPQLEEACRRTGAHDAQAVPQ